MNIVNVLLACFLLCCLIEMCVYIDSVNEKASTRKILLRLFEKREYRKIAEKLEGLGYLLHVERHSKKSYCATIIDSKTLGKEVKIQKFESLKNLALLNVLFAFFKSELA